MAVRTLLAEEGYAIEYDDDLDGVVFRWRRFVQGEAFREGCEALLSIIEDRDVTKVLIDSRELTVVDDDNVEWMFSSWVPRTTRAGLEYTATVYEENTIAKMNAERMAEYVDDVEEPSELYTTTEIEDARRWLEAQ